MYLILKARWGIKAEGGQREFLPKLSCTQNLKEAELQVGKGYILQILFVKSTFHNYSYEGRLCFRFHELMYIVTVMAIASLDKRKLM